MRTVHFTDTEYAHLLALIELGEANWRPDPSDGIDIDDQREAFDEITDDVRSSLEENIPTLPADTVAGVLDALHEALVEDIARRLTCTEADELAGLYRAVGRDDEARMLIEEHAWSDTDDGDLHHEQNVANRAEAARNAATRDARQIQ